MEQPNRSLERKADRKQVRIFFSDYGQHFDRTEEVILRLLNREYDVIMDSENPDYLFFSCGGYRHFKYSRCIKIFYTCENGDPDFNLCDYAMAHAHIQYGDRYFRAPYYRFCPEMTNIRPPVHAGQVLNRKFCNFISSSGWADPVREEIFRKLSEYKPVDSGGRTLNNIGGRVADKMTFIRDYKFTIAFENSSLRGYTTEKIVEAMAANSLPLYWGNPDVGLDFNRDAFVYFNDFDTIEAAIDEVIRLDNDDDAYLARLTAPRCMGIDTAAWEEELFLFLKNIFDPPLANARRTADYGYQYAYKRDMSVLQWLFDKNRLIAGALRKLLRLLLIIQKASPLRRRALRLRASPHGKKG
jgi:hypothetical protein